jgi:hypothetical protein
LISKLPNAEKCTNYEGIDASARLERQKRKKRRLEFEQHQEALLFEQELQPRIGLFFTLYFFRFSFIQNSFSELIRPLLFDRTTQTTKRTGTTTTTI